MKKYLFCIIGFIFCFINFISFCNKTSVQVYAMSNPESDLAEFLKFEQDIINLNSNTEFFSISSLSIEDKSLNFLNSNENSEFALKRLIVQGDVKNTYGAIDKISYNDLHILCYLSEEDTQKAFEQLQKDNSLDVIIDKKENIEKYAEKDYSYLSYTNWGLKLRILAGTENT